MKKVVITLLASVPALSLAFLTTLTPRSIQAVPSYARQTGLPCSGCHYTPPELNPAGRKFKLFGYVDKDKDKTEASRTTRASAMRGLISSPHCPFP